MTKCAHCGSQNTYIVSDIPEDMRLQCRDCKKFFAIPKARFIRQFVAKNAAAQAGRCTMARTLLQWSATTAKHHRLYL